IHGLGCAVLLSVWSEIKFGLEIAAQFEGGMKPFAFPTAKTAQRPDLFVADERLEFIAAQQPTGDGFPDGEVAFLICAGETFESHDRLYRLGSRLEFLAVPG